MPVETLSQVSEIRSPYITEIDFLGESQPEVNRKTKSWQELTSEFITEVRMGLTGLEDVTSPTPTVLEGAMKIAAILDHQEIPPPLKILPNGEGGLVFERIDKAGKDEDYEVLEIFDDLNAELRIFRNCKLVARTTKKISI